MTRMRWLDQSATNRLPMASQATPAGLLNRAVMAARWAEPVRRKGRPLAVLLTSSAAEAAGPMPSFWARMGKEAGPAAKKNYPHGQDD